MCYNEEGLVVQEFRLALDDVRVGMLATPQFFLQKISPTQKKRTTYRGCKMPWELMLRHMELVMPNANESTPY